MNKLSSLHRKLIYIGGIALLSIPIILLGMPPEPAKGGASTGSPGGKLAQLRVEYELGETNLGEVDPASSTMNLLLLGFRGIATSFLWMDAQEQQRNKDWAALRSTVDSIILLQPHFLKVWVFQGWNLAFNVSAEWDLVPDRYYWVKEGIKFYKKGKDRNVKQPELYWYIGDTNGKKIGRSDEWKQFRRFYRVDPDTVRYPNGPDPEINPEGKDNYLVANEWFTDALRIEDTYHIRQHIMADYLFRGYPSRALMDYAAILQREGVFEEVTRIAWEDAFRELTTKYGRDEFDNPSGIPLHMEVTSDEWPQIRREDEGREEGKKLEKWIRFYQSTTNYRFWRMRASAESTTVMSEARRKLYEGEQAYLVADFIRSSEVLEQGMAQFEEALEDYPDLKDDDMTIEDALIAQLFWRAALDNEGKPGPSEADGYPLQEMWSTKQNYLPSVMDEFNRRKRSIR